MGGIDYRRYFQYLRGSVPSPQVADQCDVLERPWGPPKALPIHQLDMAVNVVLVDLEFCTKSECVSVRFPRNFVRKISVNTNSTPTIGQTFTIDFESDNFTHPTRFCLALSYTQTHTHT